MENVWCQSSCHEVALELFATNTPDPAHWTLNSCFGAFRTIWVHLGLFGCMQHSVQNGSNWCKSSWHEVVSEFFTTNTPDPPQWTQNSYFCAFHTILVQLGLFGWHAKHDGKCVVPKFVPQSCIGTFRNEHTRSSPLDPKLMFWCISYRLGAFATIR